MFQCISTSILNSCSSLWTSQRRLWRLSREIFSSGFAELYKFKCRFLLQLNKAALTGGKHVLFYFGQFPGIFKHAADLDLGLGSRQRIMRVEKNKKNTSSDACPHLSFILLVEKPLKLYLIYFFSSCCILD